MREAPSIPIIEGLLDKGAKVRAYDPVAITEARSILGDKVEYASTSYSAIDGADGLVLITEWSEFRAPDFEKVRPESGIPDPIGRGYEFYVTVTEMIQESLDGVLKTLKEDHP